MKFSFRTITQKFKFPAVCFLCSSSYSNPFHSHDPICANCTSLLPKLGNACRLCAYPLPDQQFDLCGPCIKSKPHFDQIITAHRFEEPLRTIIHEFKYRNGLYLLNYISKIMLNAYENKVKPEVIIPVPLHPKRLKERGFNQALILARNLSRKLNIPFDRQSCEKKRATPPQATLSGVKRLSNLNNAFLIHPCSYQHIVIIDDIVTTGKTVDELAKLYKAQGVLKVDVWCCARAY